jgi:hypothetical protein
MPNTLRDAVSPYLRSHADNPVNWQQWGADAFAEAERRNVPVMISIGYSTCHWCHVMARESFSDTAIAGQLNENFVSIKVDREEFPDVDASYLSAASAFTDQLGWPLTVFATPRGRAFFAGTYFPPEPLGGRPSFSQVLDAVLDAWRTRQDEVESTAGQLAAALAAPALAEPGDLPRTDDFARIVAELIDYEDTEFGGFGGAPKFPVAPVLGFLLDRADAGDTRAGALARRALDAMAASDLRDPIEGGFFRYAVGRDWSEPHFERMLYDNALLLSAYSRAGRPDIAEAIADFLLGVLRLSDGAFASAQDSESSVGGHRTEGGYYALDAAGRTREHPPALDEKVLTGWNGLAIGALASAGARLGHPEFVSAAEWAAAAVDAHSLIRARVGDSVSSSLPTLEDYGMLADGLVDLALATGEVRHATRARDLVRACFDGDAPSAFRVPGGADPVLVDHGLALDADPSEGAYPSGLSAIARASARLYSLTADREFLDAATAAMRAVAPLAVPRPVSFGSALGLMSLLESPARQLVVVTDERDSELASLAQGWSRGLVSIVTPGQAEAFAAGGFELYAGRSQPAAYLCDDFVCALPITDASALRAALSGPDDER